MHFLTSLEVRFWFLISRGEVIATTTWVVFSLKVTVLRSFASIGAITSDGCASEFEK